MYIFSINCKSPHVINPPASNVPKVKLDVDNISACFPYDDDVKVLILSATSISPNELYSTFNIEAHYSPVCVGFT